MDSTLVGASMSEAELLPQSRRPDGTIRPQVRVRQGYVPPEEQATYDKFKSTGPVGVVGADPDDAVAAAAKKSASARKNEKRKEKKQQPTDAASPPAAPPPAAAEPAAPAAPAATGEAKEVSECEKKVKALNKRLRQIDELVEKQKGGAALNADQLAKVASRGEIEDEIKKWEALGDVDLGKKVKALKKKIRQIEELEEKQKGGGELNAGTRALGCTPSRQPRPWP